MAVSVEGTVALLYRWRVARVWNPWGSKKGINNKGLGLRDLGIGVESLGLAREFYSDGGSDSAYGEA